MFKFKLQTLLGYRKRKEEDLQRQLAAKNQILFREEMLLSKIEENKIEHEKELDLLHEQAKTVVEMMSYMQYFERLNISAQRQRKLIAEATKKMEEKRTELIVAVKGRKVIEKLKEKAYEKYSEEMKKQELKTNDDIAITMRQRKENMV